MQDKPLHSRSRCHFQATTSGTRPVISIVSPVYQCRPCLQALCARVAMAMEYAGEPFEIILVDDGSPDGAWDTIAELAAGDSRIRGIRLSRNFGQHYAISAGLDVSRGDHVVVIDCDLQDRPEEIPRLIEQARRGFDVVFAQRAGRQDGAISVMRPGCSTACSPISPIPLTTIQSPISGFSAGKWSIHCGGCRIGALFPADGSLDWISTKRDIGRP